MVRKKGFWIALIVILLAAGGGGYLYYANVYSAAQEPEEEAVQTATVRRGEIVISASGAGAVIPASEVELGFQSGGLLTELLVNVGDRVGAGDVLAQLDDSQARKAVVSAELQVIQAEQALAAQLDTSQAEQEVALAEANLAIAQLELDDHLNWSPDESAVEQARASLEAAEADHEALTNRSAYDSTTSARISLEQAQQSLIDMQAAYDQAWEPARDWELYMTEPTGTPQNPGASLSDQLERERASTEAGLARAYDNLEIAQANYNLSWANANDEGAELAAWNKILGAQAALEAAQSGPDEIEIRLAQIKLLQAEISLAKAQETLAAGPEQAELVLEQAELNLEIAQGDLEKMALVAPMDGTVMAINAQAGEIVSGGTLLTLADIQHPSIEIYLDETDLNSVGVNFEVDVIFDALPNDVFTGYVVQVDPALVTMSGVQMVRAVVQLDEASYAKPQVLPIGANAGVDVIGGRAENALLVPVEALNEISAGQYAVFIMDGEELVFTPVEVGLMDYSFAEILTGLKQGDVVTTGIVKTE